MTRIFAGLFAFIFSDHHGGAADRVPGRAVLAARAPARSSAGRRRSTCRSGSSIVILAIAYAAISAPFSALRRTSYATVSGQRRKAAAATASSRS